MMWRLVSVLLLMAVLSASACVPPPTDPIPAATAVTQLAMKRRLRFAIPRAAGASAISTGASSH